MGRKKKKKNNNNQNTERFFLIDDIYVVENNNAVNSSHKIKSENKENNLEQKAKSNKKKNNAENNLKSNGTVNKKEDLKVVEEKSEHIKTDAPKTDLEEPSYISDSVDAKEIEDLPEVRVKVPKSAKKKKSKTQPVSKNITKKKSEKNQSPLQNKAKSEKQVEKSKTLSNIVKQESINTLAKQTSKKTKENKKSELKTEKKPTNAFLESLKNFSASAIEDSGIHYKKHRNYSPALLRGSILAICIGVFIYSAFQIGNSIINSIKAKQIQSQIQSEFYNYSAISPASISLKSSRTYSLMEMLGADEVGITFTPPELLGLYQTLKKQLNDTLRTGKYPDGYAWVKVPGTNIDYLVVLPKDNEQYLYAAPNGTYNKSGSIFADYRTNANYLSNRHVVLYGHNMTDGTMFGSVRQFFISNDQWKMFTSTEIQVITDDGLYIYKPFALYKATLGNNYIRYEFDNDEQWVEFLQSIYDQSIFKQWTTSYKQYIKPSTRILTFSTCTNNLFDEHERYVLHAVLVNVITDDTQ